MHNNLQDSINLDSLLDPLIKIKNTLTDYEENLLQIIYDQDISIAASQKYIASICSTNPDKLKTVKVRHLLDGLVKKELISLTSGYYDTTAKGREVMIRLFE